uniref:WAS/WASL-interacting protein family member 3-like n=1 Tax=Elaeis guineensis var. tenera TaxID=51953 RepID=A0A6I9QX90_ELAGV|nr:WAS/WASL-interacting protein family member 3-like [Elaeis guineensis]
MVQGEGGVLGLQIGTRATFSQDPDGGRLKGKATEALALGPRSLASGIAVQPPPPASRSHLQALHTPSVTASRHPDLASDVPIPPPSPVAVQPPPPRLHLWPFGILPSWSHLHAPSVTASAHPSIPISPPPPVPLHGSTSPGLSGLARPPRPAMRQDKTTRSQEVRRSSRPGPPQLVGSTDKFLHFFCFSALPLRPAWCAGPAGRRSAGNNFFFRFSKVGARKKIPPWPLPDPAACAAPKSLLPARFESEKSPVAARRRSIGR